MIKHISIVGFCFFFSLAAYCQHASSLNKGISIVPNDKEHKVDILYDGKLFTSYIYPGTLEKPVLYPLTTADGTVVSRGFPLEPRSGERVDHPHHVGWWFNYGNVNDLDFWNNSYAIPATDKPKYGSIEHVKILNAKNDLHKGVLTVQCQWVNYKKEVLLNEETSFIFSGDSLRRRIIRITKLTAVNGDVTFGDNKEGLCALRVDRAFESPSDKPEVFTDASGKATTVAVLNNEGVNGVYRSSEGKEKDAVWGTRAKWVILSAIKNNEKISLALFDHPGNSGYPAHWHARGYGLFSVNNLGSKVYNSADPELKTVLKKGESITFRHMLVIKTGGYMSDQEAGIEIQKFSE